MQFISQFFDNLFGANFKNTGMWGNKGDTHNRSLNQSIKLTLKYYQRIDNMKTGSIVQAALQEQKIMNIPWY